HWAGRFICRRWFRWLESTATLVVWDVMAGLDESATPDGNLIHPATIWYENHRILDRGIAGAGWLDDVPFLLRQADGACAFGGLCCGVDRAGIGAADIAAANQARAGQARAGQPRRRQARAGLAGTAGRGCGRRPRGRRRAG